MIDKSLLKIQQREDCIDIRITNYDLRRYITDNTGYIPTNLEQWEFENIMTEIAENVIRDCKRNPNDFELIIFKDDREDEQVLRCEDVVFKSKKFERHYMDHSKHRMHPDGTLYEHYYGMNKAYHAPPEYIPPAPTKGEPIRMDEPTPVSYSSPQVQHQEKSSGISQGIARVADRIRRLFLPK